MRGVDTLITPPVLPAVTLDYVMGHLRSLNEREQDQIIGWIGAATNLLEGQIGRQFITATWEYWLDRFPTSGHVELPHPPLQSVTSVQYADGSGGFISMVDEDSVPLYQVVAPAGPYCAPGWIAPLAGGTWPTVTEQSAAVRIRYVAGYGDTPDAIPFSLRQAIYFMVGHYDQHRSAVIDITSGTPTEIPLGIQQIIREFKYTGYSSVVLR